MKTAQEILEEKFPNAAHLDWFKPRRECINEARREAIEACSEAVRLKINNGRPPTIDKQSILNLINQIK